MQWNYTSFFTSNLRRKIILTVSDRWQEFLCPFGRNEQILESRVKEKSNVLS